MARLTLEQIDADPYKNGQLNEWIIITNKIKSSYHYEKYISKKPLQSDSLLEIYKIIDLIDEIMYKLNAENKIHLVNAKDIAEIEEIKEQMLKLAES